MIKTYRDLVSSSLRLIGVLGQGQTARGQDGHDALEVLKELLDTWSSTDAMSYQLNSKSIPTISGKTEYTVGPLGDIDVPIRPPMLDSAYITYNGVETPILVVGSRQYGRVPIKSQQGDTPFYLYYDTGFPFGVISLYPVPTGTSALRVEFSSMLNTNITLDTELSYPPAYRGALRYNLAVMLAPEYGIEVSPAIATQAASAALLVQNSTFKSQRMEFDGGYGGYYDINSDVVR